MIDVTIRTGLLVRDNCAREGIVYERRKRPLESWIKDQRNVADIRRLAPEVSWWAVMPLTGGLVVVPEPMLEVLRPASYEDFLVAADNANVTGRTYLAKIFPEYVDRVIAERRGWGMH